MSNKALNAFGSNSQYLDSDEQQPSLYSSPEEWGRWLSSRLPHFPIGEVKLSTTTGPIHRGNLDIVTTDPSNRSEIPKDAMDKVVKVLE